MPMIRVAKEGNTIDGRYIKRNWLTEMAETYNSEVYPARIFVEHMRGFSPDSPFFCGGDVVKVEAKEDADGKMVLYADVAPNEKFKTTQQADQKVFPSIEVIENFVGTGKAYLGGLGATDSPASLGTEKFKFSANSPFASGVTGRGPLYVGEAVAIADFFNDATSASAPKEPTDNTVGLEGVFTSAFKNVFAKLGFNFDGNNAPPTKMSANTDGAKESTQIVQPMLSQDDLNMAAQTFAKAVSEHIGTSAFATVEALQKLRDEFTAAQAQPSHNYTTRPAATGVAVGSDEARVKADF